MFEYGVPRYGRVVCGMSAGPCVRYIHGYSIDHFPRSLFIVLMHFFFFFFRLEFPSAPLLDFPSSPLDKIPSPPGPGDDSDDPDGGLRT